MRQPHRPIAFRDASSPHQDRTSGNGGQRPQDGGHAAHGGGGPLPAPGNGRAPTAAEKSRLHGLLRATQDRLAPALLQRGRGYEWQVLKGLTPGTDGRSVVCKVQGSAQKPYAVTLAPSARDPQRIVGTCSCPYSAGSAPCKHIAAVVRALVQNLSRGVVPTATFALLGPGRRSPWESLLDRLDEALARLPDPDAEIEGVEPPENEADEPERLAWRVKLGGEGAHQIEVVPVVQRVRKRGGFSTGAAVPLIDLAERPELLETTQDDRIGGLVAALIREHGYTFRYTPLQLPAMQLLEMLIGHPRVAEADTGRPLTVEHGAIGVAVVRLPDGRLKVTPAVDGKPLDIAAGARIVVDALGVAVRRENEDRVLFSPCGEPVARLLRALGTIDPVLPSEAAGALLGRLARVERVLPVSLPPDLEGTTVEADPRTAVRVTPIPQGGAFMDLRARPIPGGPSLLPGAGTARLVATVEGERRVTMRDLQAEMSRALEVLQILGFPVASGAGVNGGAPTWADDSARAAAFRRQLPDDDAILDLVDRLESIELRGAVTIEWPEGLTARRVVRVPTNALSVRVKDGRDWFGLEGGLEVDGEVLELAKLLAAAREGKRYVEVGQGKFVEIARLMGGRLGDLAHVSRGGRGGPGVHKTAASIVEELFTGVEGLEVRRPQGWVSWIERAKNAQLLSPEPPAGLKAELRQYQVDGYRWLARLAALGVGGCLADDMGLGKTVQAIAILVDRMARGPALVVAPTSVAFNWMREVERFAPGLKPILFAESDRAATLKNAKAGDIIIASYGLLRMEIDRFAAVKWSTLVLDEAHAVKNAVSKTAKALRTIQAEFAFALTGTPLQNHLAELWSLFHLVAPGLLGTFEDFAQEFVKPIERHKDSDRKRALGRLVRPFILRRTKDEVLKELPPRTEIRLDAVLSKEERGLYESARIEILAGLGAGAGVGVGEDQRFQVLAALTKLRQLACHAKLVDERAPAISAKLAVLLDQLEEVLDEGHRALVFSQFTRHLALIRTALDQRGVKSLYLDGQTPAEERAKLVDRFQGGEGEVFLISLRAGGVGLNLTAADYVFHMDPWWNPAVEDQAADRTHRIGQTRPVTIVRIVARGTIEEKVLALHADKRDLVAGILDGTDRAGKLTTNELVSLIRGSTFGGDADDAPDDPSARIAPKLPASADDAPAPKPDAAGGAPAAQVDGAPAAPPATEGGAPAAGRPPAEAAPTVAATAPRGGQPRASKGTGGARGLVDAPPGAPAERKRTRRERSPGRGRRSETEPGHGPLLSGTAPKPRESVFAGDASIEEPLPAHEPRSYDDAPDAVFEERASEPASFAPLEPAPTAPAAGAPPAFSWSKAMVAFPTFLEKTCAKSTAQVYGGKVRSLAADAKIPAATAAVDGLDMILAHLERHPGRASDSVRGITASSVLRLMDLLIERGALNSDGAVDAESRVKAYRARLEAVRARGGK